MCANVCKNGNEKFKFIELTVAGLLPSSLMF